MPFYARREAGDAWAASAIITKMPAEPSEAADRISRVDARVARNIRRIRLKRAITQQRLAERLGVVTQAVGRFESGRVRVAAGYLPIIAETLGTSIDALFEDDQKARRLNVTGQRLAPFIRDILAITDRDSLNALNAVAKVLAQASATLAAHAAASDKPIAAAKPAKKPPKA